MTKYGTNINKTWNISARAGAKITIKWNSCECFA